MKSFTSIISPKKLAALLDTENIVIIDCRYDLFDPKKGKRDFEHSHIPGAHYADLKYDLAGPVISGKTGRHPLPNILELSEKCSDWGITNEAQVVAYDANTGAMAARLWWLLKWLGHDKVAVLNGGFANWVMQKLPTTPEISESKPGHFIPNINPHMLITLEEIEQLLGNDQFVIIDSRAEERYRGEEEPIDAISGHIPGAKNRFHKYNNDEKGCYKPGTLLKAEFSKIIKDTPADQTIFYCGSGVTGAQNVLAYYHAGLGLPKLYAGSWSEWITDPNRPIETIERK